MALYIFSDAHLGAGSDEVERHKLDQIARLFDLVRTDGDRLIILGDLFDFWFEYKHAIPKGHSRILFMLHELANSGLPIDYISGNHDFWMDDFFKTELGLTVHRDNLELEYAGKRLLLTHGDGLAPADRGYRVLKWIFRNRFFIWCYRKLPPDWGIPFARWVSGSSRSYTSQRDHTFAPDYEAYAREQLAHGFDVVAIGHLHIPVIKQFQTGTYINTGDFIGHFTYVKLTEESLALQSLD